MSEILKSNFDETEYKKVESKIKEDQSFSEKYEKIKNNPDYKLTKLEERVDRTEGNFEERFKAFKDAVLKAEKEQVNFNSLDGVASSLAAKKNEVIETIEKGFLDKIGLGGVMKFFENVSKAFDKGFLVGLSVLFGMTKIEDIDFDEVIERKKGEVPVVESDVEVKPESNLEDEKGSNSLYYYIGMNILTYLSGSEADSKKNTFKILKEKNIKYKDLEKLDKKVLSKEAQLQNIAVSNFEKTIESLKSKESKILLKSSLAPKKVKIIIENNRAFLENNDNIGKKRLLMIEGLLENNKFSYEELTFNEISLFLYKGMNSLGILGISGVSELTKDVKNFITEDNSIDLKEVEHELIGKRQGLVSDILWDKFLSEGSNFGGKQYMGNGGDELLETNMIDLPDRPEKEQLEKLIQFKNYLLGDFLNKNENLIRELGYEDKFKEKLDYRGVLLLYIALAGNKNLDELSILDLPTFYKIISLIINKENAGSGSGYLSAVGQYIVLEGDKKNIFNKEDKEAIELLTRRFTEDFIRVNIKFLKDNLGWTGLFNDKIERSIGTIGVGGIIFKYGGRYIPQLRLIGLMTSFAGALSLFTDLYGMGSSLKKDMEEMFGLGNEEKDGKKVVDLEKYMQKLEDLKGKMHVEELVVNNKKEKVVFYSGSKGLEIIFNKEIYRLDIGPNPLDKDFNLTDIWDQLSDLQILDSSKESYKGEEIDFSKINFKDNKVLLGEGTSVAKINFSDIFESLKNNDIKNPKKILSNQEYDSMEYLLVEDLSGKTDNSFFSFINERIKYDLILIKVGSFK